MTGRARAFDAELFGASAGRWTVEESAGAWTVTEPDGSTTSVAGGFDDAVALLPALVRPGSPLWVVSSGLTSREVLGALRSEERFEFDIDGAIALDSDFEVLRSYGDWVNDSIQLFDPAAVELAAAVVNGEPCVAVWPPDGVEGSVGLVPFDPVEGDVEFADYCKFIWVNGDWVDEAEFDRMLENDELDYEPIDPEVSESLLCGPRVELFRSRSVAEFATFQVSWIEPPT
jgi:hypothetical protein